MRCRLCPLTAAPWSFPTCTCGAVPPAWIRLNSQSRLNKAGEKGVTMAKETAGKLMGVSGHKQGKEGPVSWGRRLAYLITPCTALECSWP